ncbi:MAG: reverse gyrase [Candidatus Aramenus sulfurataquae]|uniref:Reverse gyrase n=1 Tax=Candidatus Aramenus sulfurataquae TaxID=1326980 RepID=W7KQ95_9CREN|nr:MAG: reverse gyrase [Candidatus Aramenus sulfurataquae]
MGSDYDIPDIIYMGSCPNCGRDVSSRRLYRGSLCENCVRDEREFESLFDLVNYLKNYRTLKQLSEYKNILEEYSKVSDLFATILGSPPLGPQRSWIIRALKGESFAIIAPPGLGKTTFGILMSLYFFTKGIKSLMIFPTKTLVKQVVGKIQQMSRDFEKVPKVSYYISGMTSSQREELNKVLESSDFDIFMSTSRYIINNIDHLNTSQFGYVFVDDVDSVLKSSKSSVSVLKLMGFTEDDVKTVKELLWKARRDESAFGEIEKLRKKKVGNKVAIFSSATITKSNPVFSSLMGFRPGSAVIYLRNVIDSYVKGGDVVDTIRRILGKLGPGGLVFVPVDKGTAYAKQLAEEINGDLSVDFISSSSTSKLDKFVNGEIDVLIGVATHYGILVRGIDIPWRVKYAVFAGIPKFRFKIGENMHPLAMLRMLSLISLVTKDQGIASVLRQVRARLRNTSPAALNVLAQKVKEGQIDDQVLAKAYEIVNENLKKRDVLEKIAEIGEISVTSDGFISSPDYLTYIQASGRTSRIFGGELTTGLSVLLVDDEKLFELLTRKLSLVLDEVKWEPLDVVNWKIGEADLAKIVEKLNSERERIKKIRESGALSANLVEKIKTTLFIVESPNKAKTISNFFSRPSIREFKGLRVYETVIGNRVLMITASGGHVYDLTTKDIGIHGVEVRKDGEPSFVAYYNTIKRCSNGHQFTEYKDGRSCPICGSENVRDKMDVVNALRNLALEADEIFIGTDPDIEGEKIAWDIYLNLRPYNPNIQRAEFHEVTRRAIIEALNNPRKFSLPLLQSQLVRRVEDRWIGFKLSKKLQIEFWKEECNKLGKPCTENRNLSAGRVQTPVLGWVIDRYNQYNNTRRKVYVIRAFDSISVLVTRQSKMNKNSKLILTIDRIDDVKEEFGPLPPYTTDALLSDSSNFYGISAQETMKIAQELFEMGLITYHRTDSTRISSVGISIAESYLKQTLGEKYKEVFRPRSWGEGGAHEAIRVTKPLDSDQLRTMIEEGELELPRRLTANHYKIYDLIFRRFITSQLVPLIVEKERVYVSVKTHDGTAMNVENNPVENIYKVYLPSQMKFEKLYLPIKDTSEPIRPKIKCTPGKDCEFEVDIKYSFMKSDVQLYTQGSLITEMKNRKIGRPSTYATIVSTLLKRRYMFESRNTKRLIPSTLGIDVHDFLVKRFQKFVSEERTRDLLERMDLIEEGKEDYRQILKQLYEEIQDIG